MDTTVIEMIRRAGGQTAVSKAINVPVTTVHSWGIANRIPHWRRVDFARMMATLPADQNKILHHAAEITA